MSNIKVLKEDAWINMQPILLTSGGTLHVVTEIENDSHIKVSLKKAVPQGFNPLILLLDYVESLTEKFIENPQEVKYSEGLEKNKYTSIELRFHGKIIGAIKDIKIVV